MSHVVPISTAMTSVCTMDVTSMLRRRHCSLQLRLNSTMNWWCQGMTSRTMYRGRSAPAGTGGEQEGAAAGEGCVWLEQHHEMVMPAPCTGGAQRLGEQEGAVQGQARVR